MKRPLSYVKVMDLLDPTPLEPVVFEKPARRSSLRGRIVRRRTALPLADSPDDIAAMIAANDL